MPDLIEIEHVSYRYPAGAEEPYRPALRDIQLRIGAGEFLALIGENGSGKSTLARLLNALLLPDEGSVRINGLDTRVSAHHPVIRTQVGMIFQRPQDQIVATSVEEDVAFGPANLGLASQEIRRRVTEALAVVGLDALKERPAYMLSAGETQRLALAGVLAMRPRCIIFDETTAMLDPKGRQMVMDQARALNQQGISILFITHLMEEAVQAQRVVALQRGTVVLDGTPEQVFSNEASLQAIGLDLPPAARAAALLQRFLPTLPDGIIREEDLMAVMPVFDGQPTPYTDKKTVQPGKQPVITVKDLEYTYMRATPLAHQALKGVSLLVNESAMHGVIGATGCGKTTLLQHFNALLRPQSGSVSVGGFDVGDPQLDVHALRSQVGLGFQQPEDQFFEQYVGDEIAFGPGHFHPQEKVRDLVAEAMRNVGIDFGEYKDRLLFTLSGGEKRKVALASVLAAQPRLLLLDEPLAGLDPHSRAEIAGYLKNLNEQGVTMVISTHQFEGLVHMMGAISVMRAGRDHLHGSPSEVFDRAELLDEVGMIAPLPVRLSWALRDKGWPIQTPAVSITDLLKAIGAAEGKTAP